MTEPARDLVLAFCFPPYADSSAVVAAKRVRETGRPVDVIQNLMDEIRTRDESLERIAGDLIRQREPIASPSHFASWSSMARFSSLGVQAALRWDRAGADYERIYSRAMFAASHVLAGRLVLTRPELHWTAEFSDPLSRGVDGKVRRAGFPQGGLRRRFAARIEAAGFAPPSSDNAFEWLEHLAYALADEIIFTNDNQLEVMTSFIADDLAARVREHAVVRPHPTLPPEFYSLTDPSYPLEPDVRHIGYFGRFYASRGLDAVLDGLGTLPVRLREQLRLHVFSPQDEEVAAQVAARGLERWVRSSGSVPYLDSMALSSRMDVLLINDAITRGVFPVNPYLPSKWSDYRGSGRPVWGLVEPGSPLDRQPLDHRSPVGHATAAAQVLARIAGG